MVKNMNFKEPDILKLIKRNSSVISTFFLITIVVISIGTFFAKPIYEASTQLLVEKNDNAIFSGKLYRDRNDPEFLETQSEIIKSKNVLLKVVKILELDTKHKQYFFEESYISSKFDSIAGYIKSFFSDILFFSKSNENANGVMKLSNFKPSDADVLATRIKENIVVSPVAGSRLLNISFKSESPELAVLIANTIAQAYIDEIMAMKQNSAGNSIEWMSKKADMENARLAQSEKALQAFMKEHDIITVENHIAILPQRLADLSRRMTDAKAKREELETSRNQIAALRKTNENADTIPGLAENTMLQSLRDQILKSEHNITELSQKYGKNHPIMIEAQANLKILKQKKEEEIRKTIQAVNNEYELARDNELKIAKSLEQTKNEVLDLNEKSIQYGILKRDIDTNKALCDALNLHINEQGVTEHSQQVNVWVTEQAVMPESPIIPNKPRNIILGAIMGLLGGLGFAFLLENLDNTVKNPDEVEGRTGLSLLAVVESSHQKDGKYPDITTDIAFAECFRALRTSILLSAPEVARKILISSMNLEEGKTTTAFNLAKAFAMIEKKVLLIDGDLRKPSIHNIFSLSNPGGLSTFLSGNGEEGLIHKTDLPNLYVMSAGSNTSNPSELFSTEKIKNLFLSLESKFDFIIVDSAPILGFPDSLLLSKVVDGTIFVSRAGKISYADLHNGMILYKKIQAPILGIVLNLVDIENCR